MKFIESVVHESITPMSFCQKNTAMKNTVHSEIIDMFFFINANNLKQDINCIDKNSLFYFSQQPFVTALTIIA